MTKETKLFTRDEVKNGGKDIEKNLFIINNKVYDVQKFLNDHPGGEEVLAEQRGKDASEPFGDVGHSKDALEMMDDYLIGELVESERTKIREDDKNINNETKDGGQRRYNNEQESSSSSSSSGFPYGLIIVSIIAVIIAFNYGIFS